MVSAPQSVYSRSDKHLISKMVKPKVAKNFVWNFLVKAGYSFCFSKLQTFQTVVWCFGHMNTFLILSYVAFYTSSGVRWVSSISCPMDSVYPPFPPCFLPSVDGFSPFSPPLCRGGGFSLPLCRVGFSFFPFFQKDL